MKVSYDWLKEHITTDLSAKKIAEILTDTGLEVEKVETVEAVKGGLKGIVVGEITKLWQHPNADRLNVTNVNIGGENDLQVVCGAANAAEGQKILIATIGATIHPAKGDSFKIKKGKLRGELSEGMICAEDELGLGKSHDGIMVLPNEAVPGTPAAEYLKLEGDTSMEIGLTPNRTDGMGHFGVARDLFVGIKHMKSLEGETLKCELKLSPAPTLSSGTNHPISVEIEDSVKCNRYTGICISDLEIKESPEWLKKRLLTIGLEPINNVVDAANYAMHDLGHPLHAFDKQKIVGNKIVVKSAAKNQKFTTLDGKERELNENDLIIANNSGNSSDAMCIAGVFGGEESGVSDSTTSIFLECAAFDPVSVRKTAKRHQLNTDASFRFERGIDPDACINVLSSAAKLIMEVAGGTLEGNAVDLYPNMAEKAQIEFSTERCNKLIGIEIPTEKIEAILVDLDFEIEKKDDYNWICNAPKYRADVTREADVIEEVLRIYGYNSIPLPEKLNSSLSYFHGKNEEKHRNQVADMLSAQGFLEMMTNSLTKTGHSAVCTNESFGEPVALLNPLSSDLGELRTSLAYNMLETVIFNINRKSSSLRLYEFGNVYAINSDESTEGKYKEKLVLGILTTGKQHAETWNTSGDKFTIQNVLQPVIAVLQKLNVSYKLKQEEGVLSVKNKKKTLATVRRATKTELAHFNIKQEVFLGFIEWANVVKLMSSEIKYSKVSKFPAVTRDLSILLDSTVLFSELANSAQQMGGNLLKDTMLFDVYEGDKLPKGKKSYAIRFTLEDDSRTLDDKTIDKVMDKIIKAYGKTFGAELR